MLPKSSWTSTLCTEPSTTTSTGDPHKYRDRIWVSIFSAVVTDENNYYGGNTDEKEGGDGGRIKDNNPDYSSD